MLGLRGSKEAGSVRLSYHTLIVNSARAQIFASLLDFGEDRWEKECDV